MEKSTTGLNVEIYYDSEILTPLSVEDQLTASVISRILWKNLADEFNTDEEERTDKYIGFYWADLMGEWAGGTEIHTLANIKFKVAQGADLTSATTSLNVNSSGGAIGYNFYGKTFT